MDNNSTEVSVIIPVYNQENTIQTVLDALRNQSYPSKKTEIIIVDNGSTDTTCEIVNKNSEVTLLHENEYPNSPYSARNRGIEYSAGRVLAFTDANCVPDENWIESGLKELESFEADLLGGKIEFILDRASGAAEIVDTLTSLKMEESIIDRGAAYTSNLFVKKEIITVIGKFPEGIRSGGDVRFSSKAVATGFKLYYGKSSIVYKYPRSFSALVRKKWRIARTLPTNWSEVGRSANLRGRWMKLIHPNSIETLRSECPDYAVQYFDYRKYKVWCIWYFLQVILEVGIVYGFVKKKNNYKV